MKIISVILLATLSAAAPAQIPQGKWHDISKDDNHWNLSYGSDSTKTVLNEDYEVVSTHEICANVIGYFMEKSQQGRYNVYFKGLRSSAIFTFTTQYDAEHWAQKW